MTSASVCFEPIRWSAKALEEQDFYLLMMPGDKKFKTKDLSKELGVSRD